MANGNNWELKSAKDVAEGLDWLRRRMKGKGLVLVAIGVNSISFCKDVGISADDAADLVQNAIPNLRRGLSRIQGERVTRGFNQRTDA